MSESEEKMIQIKHKLAKNVWEQEENKKHGISTFLDPEFEIEDMLFLFEEIARLQKENEIWRRIWETVEEKLEQAPLGEEPLEFWGGYRAALLVMRDLATRERDEPVDGMSS